MTEIKEKAAVVICVYNNAAALPDVVDRAVLQKCAQVIVVDDGSTDCDVEEILKNKNGEMKITPFFETRSKQR